jgi:sphingomyelin phosphodiesterase
MTRLFKFMACVAAATQAWAATSLTYGPSSFAPPGPFPTSLYQSYYNDPTATAAQPQPVISDPVLVRIFTTFVNRPTSH